MRQQRGNEHDDDNLITVICVYSLVQLTNEGCVSVHVCIILVCMCVCDTASQIGPLNAT